MNRKVIFLDIDGTLTKPGHNEPPQSARKAIEQARKAGHYVFLCTGRNYDMLSPLLQYGFDGVAGSSGGYIVCGEEVIYDCPMTEQQKQSAMSILEKNGIFRTLECKDGAFTDEGFKDFLRKHAKKEGNSEYLRWREQIEKSLHILPMEEYKGQPAYKIVFMSPSMEALAEPRKVLSEDFVFCIQGEDLCGVVNGEAVNRKCNKGKAIKMVCEHLHIPLSDSIAIGDSMNDIEMLKTAGTSICMANGNAELKKLVDDVCPSVEEDGIYAAFMKYGLLG